MTLTDYDRHLLVKLEIDKANKIMKEAQFCSRGELWNLVGNRLYYSIFHAVVALLISKGISVHSHKGAGRMFSLHFVKQGIFSIEDQMFYSRLQTIRERADYQNDYELSPTEGAEYLEMAQLLLSKIIIFLGTSA